jgi:2-methylcitrate dehydratase PrpD
VETYHPATTMTAVRPVSPLQAKFSIPYAIAARLVYGNAGPDAFSKRAIRDERVLDLASRVLVSEDRSMSERFPLERSAKVVVHMRSGQTYAAHCRNARGDFNDPHPVEMVLVKFRSLAGRVLADNAVSNIERMIMRIDDGPTARGLMNAMSSPDSVIAKQGEVN